MSLTLIKTTWIKAVLFPTIGVLTLSCGACTPERLDTSDTCIELNSISASHLRITHLPTESRGQKLLELSERSSEVLADELKIIGEVSSESAEQRDRRFLIDAEYDAVQAAIETVNGACR